MSLLTLLSIRWSALAPHMFVPSPRMCEKKNLSVSEGVGDIYAYTHGCAREYDLQISSSIAKDDEYDIFLRA